MNQKGFAPIIIILGIVLLVTVVGGAYYFGKSSIKSSTPPSQVPVSTSQTAIFPTQPTAKTTISLTPTIEETTNWKTYTNRDFFYEFKYPSNWSLRSLKETPDSKNQIQNSIAINPFRDGLQQSWDEITVESVKIQTTKDRVRFNDFVSSLKFAKDFKLGNVPAQRGKMTKLTKKEMSFNPPEEEILNVVLLEHNNSLFIFTSTGYGLNVFDQILSTFKFLN